LPKCLSAVARVELPNKMVLMLHCLNHQRDAAIYD
jgi:hypothetical protein